MRKLQERRRVRKQRLAVTGRQDTPGLEGSLAREWSRVRFAMREEQKARRQDRRYGRYLWWRDAARGVADAALLYGRYILVAIVVIGVIALFMVLASATDYAVAASVTFVVFAAVLLATALSQ
jgi:hypothetical protein